MRFRELAALSVSAAASDAAVLLTPNPTRVLRSRFCIAGSTASCGVRGRRLKRGLLLGEAGGGGDGLM